MRRRRPRNRMRGMLCKSLLRVLGVFLVLGGGTFLLHCSKPVTSQGGDGSAVIGVSTMALSATDVAKVTVTITGANISPPIVQDLVQTGGQWKGTIGAIPVGSADFNAKAYDSGSNLIYEGDATGVNIQKGAPATVLILLQQTNAPTPFQNSAPQITSLVASANQVAPQEDVELAVAATDAEGNPLTYAWSETGSNGSFAPANAASTTWTAPTSEGTYTLNAVVSDNQGGQSAISLQVEVNNSFARGTAQVSAEFNTWPEVAQVTSSKGRVDVNETTQLDVSASDADGDSLTYAWSDGGGDCAGSFSSTSVKDPTWTAPASLPAGGTCTLTVTVTDGRGGTNTGSKTIQVAPPIVANLAPKLETTFQSAERVANGTAVTFRVSASDAQTMIFGWGSTGGTNGTSTDTATTSEMVWTAPAAAGTYQITATITDAPGATTTHTFSVEVINVWVAAAGSSGSDQGNAVVYDASGNTYVTGIFSGTVSFGSTSLTSSGGLDIFVAKLDVSGSWVWAVKAGGPGNDSGAGLVRANGGQLYVAGYFSGTATWGSAGATVITPGLPSAFVARLNDSGTAGVWQWILIPTAGYAYINSIAIDGLGGNLYVAGRYHDTATFGAAGALPAAPSSSAPNGFVAKVFDNAGSHGTWQWASAVSGAGFNDTRSVALSGSNVYIAGNFTSSTTLGSTTLTSAGGSDVFVAKLQASDGAYLWAKQAGGSTDDVGSAIIPDGSGNTYVTGSFNNTATFGSTSLTSAGGKDIFVTKLDTSGNFQWTAQAGGSGDDEGLGVAFNFSLGQAQVVGSFSGSASFGGNAVTSAGGKDAFVARINTSGGFQSVITGGSASGDDSARSVKVDANGVLYITGDFGAAATFNGASLTHQGSNDIFVWRYIP